MRLATFLEKFDQFADAPNAVEKLRELVLRLAANGRLTEKDPSEPSGQEAVAAIVAARDRKAQEGAARLRDVGNPQTAGDTMEIPEAWARSTIGEVCELHTGATPSRTQPDYFNGEIRWLVSGDINQRVITDCIGRITKLGLDNSNCKVVPPKAILIALNGQGKTRGMVALLHVPAALNQSLVAMVPFSSEHLLPEYVYWNLRGRYYAIRDITGQDQRRGLNMKLVGQLSLPIPPTAEQKRIVAKVHELMALCDRLEAQQQERQTRHAALACASLARFADAPTPANLDFLFHNTYTVGSADLRKRILTLAIQGRLVPQDDGDGTASDLLAEISALKTSLAESGRYRGSTAVSPMDPDEGDYELPSNWAWVRFGDLMVNRDGERVPVSKEQRATKAKEYDYYGASGVIDKIDGFLFDKPLLLIGEDGANLINRSTPIAFIARGHYWVNNHAHVLDGINEDFLRFVALHINAINLEPYVTGSAQPKMNQAKMNTIPIAVPPLQEQRRIVAKADQLMALVDQLDAQLTAARATSVALLDAAIQELVNPIAEVIALPSAERGKSPDRAAIGCYAIQQLGDKRTFGRTAEVKVLYLAETHLGLDLGGRYLRDAAGPLDQWIYKFEEEAARQQWFGVVESLTKEGHKKIDYRPGPNLSVKAQEGATRLSAAQRREFDRLLGLLAQKPTVEVEIIATLFAAWNDFLIDCRTPSDDEIVQEVREHWHPSKQRFTQAELKTWLAWLRQHALVPQGKGPHTVGQQGKLQLH